ncbi:MAG: hypothetical protein GY762_11750 [Proteobacteria bacterium]|nr:hypothetical protein [Pseudomonadota bacterium]
MTNKNSSILVLGASGGLGQHICREVIRQYGPTALVVGDYKPDRGQQTARRLGVGFLSRPATTWRLRGGCRRVVAAGSRGHV